MYLVRLMWRSESESKPFHSRYSQLSQAWRAAEPIRIISAVSNWFRNRTSHELNSMNAILLMWSTASEQGLKLENLLRWSLSLSRLESSPDFLQYPLLYSVPQLSQLIKHKQSVAKLQQFILTINFFKANFRQTCC